MVDESQDLITITYKVYKDEVFLGADQAQVGAKYEETIEDRIADLNDTYKHLYNNNLRVHLFRVELFAVVGV